MRKEDGGLVFGGKRYDPVKNTDGTVIMAEVTWPGISLRDAFAWQALPWCLEQFAGNADDQTQFAEVAYQIADALLKARGES